MDSFSTKPIVIFSNIKRCFETMTTQTHNTHSQFRSSCLKYISKWIDRQREYILYVDIDLEFHSEFNFQEFKEFI
jgi:hypothetical protein